MRLSESEKAVLERRAVLQERADRIKDREARRKANLKRKEERVQREREARHRMGIATPPTKEGIHVGPSQLHLSGFMYAGTERKREDREEVEVDKKEKSEIHNEGELVVQEHHSSPTEPPPSRQPLQLLSANANTNPQQLTPSLIAKANPPNVRDFAFQKKAASPKQAPALGKYPPFQLQNGMREDEVPEPIRSILLRAQETPEIQKRMGLSTLLPPLRRHSQLKATTPTSQQKPSQKVESIRTSTVKTARNQMPAASTEGPPPPRHSIQATTFDSATRQEKPSILVPPNSEAIPEDNFDDFFVSNTQIQREISPLLTSPAKNTPIFLSKARPPTPTPLLKPPAAADKDTADLLALISTQDLDFSVDITQRPSPTAQDEPEADEDFPDDELDDIVLEFELESPVKSNKRTADEETLKPDPLIHSNGVKYDDGDGDGGSHYDSDDPDDAELQAGLQSVCGDFAKEEQSEEVAEWDAFGLSTQDLMELET